jgi:NTP pyrophosphatase (non-canonical NTP hydrolase)
MRLNELTDAEEERLHLLIEEMGEAIQAAGKVLRHGYESSHPNFKNRDSLEAELGDVFYAIALMLGEKDISQTHIEAWQKQKAQKIAQYLHHQCLGDKNL